MVSLTCLELCCFPIVYSCHAVAIKEMYISCDNDLIPKFRRSIKSQAKLACHFGLQSFTLIFVRGKWLCIFSHRILVKKLKSLFMITVPDEKLHTGDTNHYMLTWAFSYFIILNDLFISWHDYIFHYDLH